MGLKEYIKNKKRYKTDDLYVGALFLCDTFSDKINFVRIAILRKLSHKETLKILKKEFDYSIDFHKFWKNVPNYIREGYKLNDVDFYTQITDIPDYYGEAWVRSIYAHTTPQHIKQSRTTCGHYLILPKKPVCLKEIKTKEFQFLDTINYESIRELEEWIKESINEQALEK